MPQIIFHPFIKWFTGRVDKLILRRSHNGKISAYREPDMSRVKWSRAQKDHRQRMSEAWKYASAAVADPDLRPIYVRMAREQGRNPSRPFDTAVSDYYHSGNDLLWKKHMGDREKPADWEMWRYDWYFKEQKRR